MCPRPGRAPAGGRAARPAQLATSKRSCDGSPGRAAILRVSTECYTCYHWLPGVLQRFARRFSQGGRADRAEATHPPCRRCSDGRIDLAIVSNDDHDDRLAYVPLFSDELVAAAPPRPPAQRQAVPHRSGLRGSAPVRLPAAAGENDVFTKLLSPAGVMRAASRRAVDRRRFWSWSKAARDRRVARWAVSPTLKTGELKGGAATAMGWSGRWRAAMLRQRPVPLHLREFAGLLAAGPTVCRGGRSGRSGVAAAREFAAEAAARRLPLKRQHGVSFTDKRRAASSLATHRAAAFSDPCALHIGIAKCALLDLSRRRGTLR